MKKLYLYSAFFFLFALLINCKGTKTNIEEIQGLSRQLVPKIDTNHIVVRFTNGESQQEINKFIDSLPFKKDNQYINRCKCGDPNLLELTWDYDNYPLLEIQSARNALTGRRGSAQGDTPFTFSLPVLSSMDSFDITNIDELGKKKQVLLASLRQSLQATPGNGKKINIVIIDTGIDFYKNRDQKPFLYKTQNTVTGCTDQQSGWNFINNSNDIMDDHGHGTYVTRLITSVLQDHEIGYRILPIKAFNSEGEGKYWDIVCALSYVKQLQNLNDNLQIVNASFGYSFFGLQISDRELEDYKNNSIAKELIDELRQSTIFVASAGNSDQDIDIIKQENFPASFASENILGVGGYVLEGQTRATGGNYGNISIDVASPYTDYKFTFNNKFNFSVEEVTLTGSSYSAAFTSAKIAILIKSLQPTAGSNSTIIPPNTIKTQFYDDVNNSWVKIDTGLDNKISKGRYQEY